MRVPGGKLLSAEGLEEKTVQEMLELIGRLIPRLGATTVNTAVGNL
jgi:hypothetical protein